MQKINILNISFSFLFIIFCQQLIAQVYQENAKSEINPKYIILESIDLHTDKDLYVAGDNLFFKLYLNNSNTEENAQLSNYAYILLRNENGNITKLITKVDNKNSFGSVYLADTLKTGIYQLLAYTNYMRNFSEKSYFNKNILIINRFDKLLNDFYLNDSTKKDVKAFNKEIVNDSSKKAILKIELEKDSFYVREKIRIKIKNDNSQLKHSASILSITVKEFNPLINPNTNSSVLANPFFKEEDSEIDKKGISKTVFKNYLPEKEGIYLQGTVQNDAGPIKGECLYISTVDSVANLQYAYSDEYGNFRFLLDDYYLGKGLIIKFKDNRTGNDSSRIALEDKFNLKSIFKPVLPQMSVELKKSIYNSQDIMQVQKAYNTKKVIFKQTEDIKNKDFPIVYRAPFITVIPSRFVPLNDFKEIVDNLLMGVKMTREKKEYEIYVANQYTQVYYNYQPAIFLDGVPLDNIQQIIGLTSNDISRIELSRVLKVKGDLNFPGIISVFSYKNVINSISHNKPFVKLKMENLLNKAYYEIPNYNNSQNQDNNPDFRQLLYWNPDVHLNPNEDCYIEFNASDYLTDYLIEVVGFSENGVPVAAYTKIKIYH